MKKILPIILTAVTVMALLTGCGCVRMLLDIAADDTVEDGAGTNQSQIAGQGAGQQTNPAGSANQSGAGQATYATELAGLPVTDDNGNTVPLGSILSKNKVTLINFWATYCDSCLSEMPSLNSLNDKYKSQGFQVIGITTDTLDYSGSLDSEMVDYARDLISSLGVTYPIYNYTYELDSYANIYSLPTTYLVDSNGNLLTDPIYGALSESRWDSVISQALSSTN